jgi:hypothetical protein
MSDTSLYRKLSEVVAEVEGVAKDGRNAFHNYDYTTAETLLRALRKPLSARKVMLLSSVTDIGEREIRTAKGGASTITTVRVQFTFVDSETGEKHACEWAGQGDDPADKGLGKAYTNAIKTFLREQFLIPQGDDPEADSKTDARAAERAPSNGQKKKPSPLSDSNRAKVLKAFADAGINDLTLYFTAVGLERVEDMTAEHAVKLRGLLDKELGEREAELA